MSTEDATQLFRKAKSSLRLPKYWRLALVRCTIYACMVGWGSFESGVEGFEALSDLSPIQKLKLCGNIFVAMGGVWLAFLDQTLSRVGNPQQDPSQQKENG